MKYLFLKINKALKCVELSLTCKKYKFYFFLMLLLQNYDVIVSKLLNIWLEYEKIIQYRVEILL